MSLFRDMVMAYLVIGLVMWGGGAIELGDTGVSQVFIEQNESGGIEAADTAGDNINSVDGAITQAIDFLSGGLLLVWRLGKGLFGYMHWPIVVLHSNNAPPSITALVGGGFTAAFYLGIVELIRGS